MDTAPGTVTVAARTGRVAVVAPEGHLTEHTCASLRAELREASAGVRLLVVDLLAVPTIDDAIVQVLVGAAARCDAAGASMLVANADRQPWTVLTRARLSALRLHRRKPQPLSDLLHLLEH